MPTFDLQPLTIETIQKMGFNNHDLWMVKIDQEVYGPFDLETLKTYAAQNKELMSLALASRAEPLNFEPISHLAQFENDFPRTGPAKGAYWILLNGMKSGPFSQTTMEKKISSGELLMLDVVSMDDGHSWEKISEVKSLPKKVHEASELPLPPLDSSFQKAKLSVLEKIDHGQEESEDLAEMAHEGQLYSKTNLIKLEEVKFHETPVNEVSPSLNWAITAALFVVLALGASGYYLISTEELAAPQVAEASLPEEKVKKPKRIRGEIPRVERLPASVAPAPMPVPGPRYEENDHHNSPQVDSPHQYEEREEPVEHGPEDNQVAEAPATEEHSLVGNEDQSLDAAMNGVNQPADQPVVEEATDF
jgi:hypothetical protein